MGRSTGPDRASIGMTPKRVARSDGALRKTLIRLLSVSSASPLWAGAVAPETACEAADIVPCALPAEVPVAWLTAAAWLAVPPGSVFWFGEANGVSAVADADRPA